MSITSIDSLIQAAQGELVALPPFSVGTEFIARLRRPSMMKLATSGKIPNSLMSRANALFVDRALEDPDTDGMLKELGEVLEVIAEACFVEPKYQDLKDAGITLTDQQYIAVFQYSQRGVEDIKPSNGAEEDSGHCNDVENV